MKKSLTRILALLFVLSILFGLMPTISYAGGDEEISSADLFISYPMAGQHPNTKAVPCSPQDTEYYTVDYCYYYNDDGMGRVVFDEETFVAGETYKAQVHLYAKPGYDFTEFTAATINRRSVEAEDVFLVNSDEVFYAVSLTAASETVTVSFDANGYGTAPKPIQVPIGGTVWDCIRNFDAVRMSAPYARFWDWSDDPFDVSGFFPFTTELYAPMTLYGVWTRCVKSVELYVTLPEKCLTEDVGIPTVRTGRGASYSADADWFYPSQNSVGVDDLIYNFPMEKGKTYYSRISVYTDLGGALPEIHLYGGTYLEARRVNDYWFDVIYSVTVPSGSSITSCQFYLETPKAGSSADNWLVSGSLTPGIIAEADAWYPSSAVGVTAPCEGVLEAGKTYYTRVDFRSSSYSIRYDKLKPTPVGLNVKVLELYDLASWYSIPNFVGACVSVRIPNTYILAAEVPYGGGKIRYDRAPNDAWHTVLDFGGEEEGPVTLEAKADPNHLFKMWYDAKTYERLSKNAVYTFNLNKDVNIRASFVEKPPFVDVGAWDYFYEPVMWALAHDPQITGGVDATHFGPNENCTRAQVMTFLWKALKEPWSSSYSCPFVDVKPGNYYYKPVVWAYRNNVTGGVDPTHFGPGENCTRAQVMTYLWASKGRPQPSGNYNPFKDVKPSDYYYKAVLWAVENGVTAGVGDGLFGSDETCTRAQVMTFLCKVYGPKG